MLFPDLSAMEFVKKLGTRIRNNAATDRAAQLSYYFLFALFPFLFFVVTLAAYLPVKGLIEELLARVDPLMPDEAMAIIRVQLTSLATRQRPHLLTFGLALALWSASRGVDALRTSLNLSYDVKESRPWWRTQGTALLITMTQKSPEGEFEKRSRHQMIENLMAILLVWFPAAIVHTRRS